jgi:hypothetical protein
MAKLTNMKRDADEGYASSPGYNPGQYPSGLCIWLDEDQCDALGIAKAMKPGTQVTITATAVVTTATESLESDGDDKGNDVRMSLQITDLGVTPSGTLRNAAAELYRSTT